MQDCKISVIVPVYNVAEYLRKCVNSILENSYRELEVILIDDGSTDNSGDLCNELAIEDHRIIVIHKTNGGLSSARNAGLEIASGEYISFVDSDDYIEVDMYEKMIKRALEEDADIIQCGVYRIDESGNLSTTFYTEDWHCKRNMVLEYFYVFQKIPVMVCNKLFRASLIGNKRFVEGRNNEDNMFMVDILPDVSNMVSLSEQLYYYLIRTSSITRGNFTEKKFDSIYAYKYMIKKTKDIEQRYLPYIQYWRCKNAFYLWHGIENSNLDRKQKKQYKYIINQEFLETYPYVLQLGKKLSFKDRLILSVFKFNKNFAVKLYEVYLKRKIL